MDRDDSYIYIFLSVKLDIDPCVHARTDKQILISNVKVRMLNVIELKIEKKKMSRQPCYEKKRHSMRNQKYYKFAKVAV